MELKAGMMRAADADRDRVVSILSSAFGEGRLSQDEYDARMESALSARTYAELDQIVADIPAGQAAIARREAEASALRGAGETNMFAMASFVCGLAQVIFGPLATVLAIAFGYVARSQIKRTGQQGSGLAVTGLILGWAAVILGIAFIIVYLAAGGAHGTAHLR
jgi:hypothetical protein